MTATLRFNDLRHAGKPALGMTFSSAWDGEKVLTIAARCPDLPANRGVRMSLHVFVAMPFGVKPDADGKLSCHLAWPPAQPLRALQPVAAL